jgi:hypothetical protein
MNYNMANVHLGDSPKIEVKQGYVTCAFLHGELEPSENVYVEMPLGFSQCAKMEPGRFFN